MKLKTLALAVALLAVLSAATWFAQRPAPVAAADPRIGQPLLPASVIQNAARFTLTEGDQTVTVVKGAGDTWTVPSYHDFPADIAKLIRTVDVLQEARIERLVTTSPDYIARLGFGTARLAFQDAAGKDLWALAIGKVAEKGGTFVQVPGESKAFLGNFTIYLDTDAENWTDRQLIELAPSAISALEINFPEENGLNLRFTRAKSNDPFTSPDGRTPKQDELNNLVALHSAVSFSTTEPSDSPGAREAAPRSRALKLTTFDGHTVTLTYSQRPAPKVERPADQGELVPLPEPVYVKVAHSDPAAPVNALMAKRAFRTQESILAGLPAKSADLFGTPPAPTSGPASVIRMP
jgi:hypothetical protein